MNTQIRWPLRPLFPKPQPFFHSNNSRWTQPFTKNSLSPTISHNLSKSEHPIPSPTSHHQQLALSVTAYAHQREVERHEGHQSNPKSVSILWKDGNKIEDALHAESQDINSRYSDRTLDSRPTNTDVPGIRSMLLLGCNVLKKELRSWPVFGPRWSSDSWAKRFYAQEMHIQLELTSCQAMRVTWSHKNIREGTWCSSFCSSLFHLSSEEFQSFIPLPPFLLRPWGCTLPFSPYFFLLLNEKVCGLPLVWRVTYMVAEDGGGVNICEVCAHANFTQWPKEYEARDSSCSGEVLGLDSALNSKGSCCRMPSAGSLILISSALLLFDLEGGEVLATVQRRADLKYIWWMS